MKKLTIIALVTVLVASLLPGIATRHDPQPAVAQDTGSDTLTLPGLDAEVRVLVDEYGVSHIYASTRHDLLMAQGYVQASDRWWQMDYNRHMGMGRLAELVGPDALPQDIFFRTVGTQRNAETDLSITDDETLADLESFADGVNAYLDGKAPEELALEYALLAEAGIEVEVKPWEPLHTQVWLQVMNMALAIGGLEEELFVEQIFQQTGTLGVQALRPRPPIDRVPVITSPGWTPASDDGSFRAATEMAAVPTLDLSDLALMKTEIAGYLPGVGSNSWVIGGDLTASGKPLLANDPHLAVEIPPIWYEIGLHCVELSEECPFDMMGMVFPNMPYVTIGHNQHIGWGFTNAGTDVVDNYRLTLNPDNALQYEFNGEWRDIDVIEETFNVAGGDAITVPVVMTHFGPLVNELVGYPAPLAMRWSTADGSETLRSFAEMAMATNWEEFQQAATYFDSPAQNTIYADVEGNIGYLTTGVIPLRAAGHDGTMPVDAVDDSLDWQGYMDQLDNPRVYNPEAGYIVTANNTIVDPAEYPELANSQWAYGHRAGRIEMLIQARGDHTIDSIRAIHLDSYNPAGSLMMPILQDMEWEDETLAGMVEWLGEWDYQDSIDSPYSVMFNAFWLRLMHLLFDELGENNVPRGIGSDVYRVSTYLDIPHPLWRNEALGLSTQDEVLSQAFAEGYELALTLAGDDPAAWRWSEVHRALFIHSLTTHNLAVEEETLQDWDTLLNRRVPIGGSGFSPNAAHWLAGRGDFDVPGLMPSMRLIWDFSDLDNSVMIISAGQSGDPDSPHYDDQMGIWQAGDYIPAPYSPAAVEASAVTERIFQPE